MGTRNHFKSLTEIEICHEKEMQHLGKLISLQLQGNEIILLQGPLGAGKTTLAQGVGSSLGLAETILSPTFVLVREYGKPVSLIHVDLYRIDSVEELRDIGIQEILGQEVIRIIEWADKFPGLSEWADYVVNISILSETKRRVTVHGK